MRVAFGAQLGLVFPGALIMVRVHVRAIIDGVAQARVTTLTHDHQTILPLCLVMGATPA